MLQVHGQLKRFRVCTFKGFRFTFLHHPYKYLGIEYSKRIDYLHMKRNFVFLEFNSYSSFQEDICIAYKYDKFFFFIISKLLPFGKQLNNYHISREMKIEIREQVCICKFALSELTLKSNDRKLNSCCIERLSSHVSLDLHDSIYLFFNMGFFNDDGTMV